MSDKKKTKALTREERLAEQLRANLRRRKSAARKSPTKDRPKKDASQP